MHGHWNRARERFTGWTADLVERLTKLWVLDGLTATEIAEVTGLSRGQVMGKLNRAGLVGKGSKPRATKLRKSVKVAKPRTRKPGALAQAAPDQEAEHRGSPFSHVPPPPLSSTIETSWDGIAGEVDRLRFRECRFPLGDPIEGYCRNRVESYRLSYCPYHEALTHYVKQPKGKTA